MDQKALQAALRWWQSMTLSPAELKALNIRPAPTVYRARLHRCATPEAAMLTDGFKALWFSLPEEVVEQGNEQTMECWATIAAALVAVKTATDRGIAYEAGRKGKNDKSVVSALRFAQLQNAKTPQDLLRRLRRILHQLKGAASPKLLIEDINQWFNEHNALRPRKADKRISVRWAISYYQAAAAKKHTSN